MSRKSIKNLENWQCTCGIITAGKFCVTCGVDREPLEPAGKVCGCLERLTKEEKCENCEKKDIVQKYGHKIKTGLAIALQ